jgi:hypothetical protein
MFYEIRRHQVAASFVDDEDGYPRLRRRKVSRFLTEVGLRPADGESPRGSSAGAIPRRALHPTRALR